MAILGVFMAVFSLLCIRASAQSIISTRAGLVYFAEGGVAIDGRSITPIKSRFPEIPDGSLLTTDATARAEILLGPEVFLWLGPNSSVRMRRNTLEDTVVEIVGGSAIIESRQLPSGDSVTVIFNASEIRLAPHVIHRFDASDALGKWVDERRQRLAAASGANPAKKRSHPQRRPYPAVMVPLPGRS